MAKYLSSFSPHHMDVIFQALSDSTRRDILKRLISRDLTVTEIAKPYDFALPTVSKHLKVLEKAALITKEKKGREYTVRFEKKTMKTVEQYVQFYTKYWNKKFDRLEVYLRGGEMNGK